MTPERCRVCSCTDFNGCIEPDGFPCCWVEDDHCSSCAFFAQGDKVEWLEAEDFIGKEVTAPGLDTNHSTAHAHQARETHEHIDWCILNLDMRDAILSRQRRMTLARP